MRLPSALFLICTVCLPAAFSEPAIKYLDDQFTLPEGFHIYQYVEPSLVEIAYSIAFDRKANLYLGEGEGILRVSDKDGDGVADTKETIAMGLGDRGPQGLLFLGDSIFADGDDNNWILEDLDANGAPQSRRKIGGPIKVGGDHHAHAFIRGMDGYAYWLAGNDTGFSAQGHITEANSPIRRPDASATVFRISPDGAHWEAVSNGCRNPYDIAINSLGEIMTCDSDHEGQITLPFYRSPRVNNFVTGGRQGWISWGEGLMMSYLIDNLPGLHTIGRASPTGLVFYEHNQFPAPYQGALFMGDYMNKRSETLKYATTGRILVFRMKRNGATWEVEENQELFAIPRQVSGSGMKFAVIDLAVAPDGSLLVSTSDDGVLRIFYDPAGKGPKPLQPVAGLRAGLSPLDEILAYPQPAETWAQGRLDELAKQVDLRKVVKDPSRSVQDRLRAFRLVAPQFKELPSDWVVSLCGDKAPEIRAQGAWLLGLRANPSEESNLVRLLKDQDGIVRRRSAEALARFSDDQPFEPLLPLFLEQDRWVRFAGMHALSHRSPENWMEKVLGSNELRFKTAGLVSLFWTSEGESPGPETCATVSRAIEILCGSVGKEGDREDLLEILRVTQIWRGHLDSAALAAVTNRLPEALQHEDLDVLKEASRLAGQIKLAAAAPILASRLPEVSDPVLQVHLMDQLSAIKEGWTPELEAAVIAWLDASDEGWHGDRRGKGTSYPDWWNRIVSTFIDNHDVPVLDRIGEYHLTGPFGAAVLAKAEHGGMPAGVDLATLRDLRQERIDARMRDMPAGDRPQVSNQQVREFVLSEASEGGVVEIGKDLFHYYCMTCHDPKAGAARRGPNLDQIRSGTPELLIDSILEPSKTVKKEFRNHIVTMNDGEIVTGLPIEETTDEIVYAGEGEPQRLRREDIERITITENSPMPENLLNGLSWNEIRDLWSYLRGGEEQRK